jgi:hypothetical protein
MELLTMVQTLKQNKVHLCTIDYSNVPRDHQAKVILVARPPVTPAAKSLRDANIVYSRTKD